MEKTLRFLIAVVFCFYITSAKGDSIDDVSLSQKEIANYAQVDTVINKDIYSNGSELGLVREDECRCNNGKCVRECDIKETGPCDDQKMVCVCNPEFAKKAEGECEYCDCGKGFDCTFEWSYNAFWQKTCICPDGYFYNEMFSSKCIPECSINQPCKHGGRCSYYGGHMMCACPKDTRGFLCEEINCGSKCQNRLEVDCLYNQYERVVYCDCKKLSLYYDQEADICKPCQCENGNCGYEFENHTRKLVCKCHYGYKNFNGYCKECNCGDGALGECEFDSNGEKICKCFDGFYEREGQCRICGCHGWRDSETKCEVTGNTKHCFCRQGYKNVLGHCEDIDECERYNPCPPPATCFNTPGSFFCECPDGYIGTDGIKIKPGESCQDIDECDKLLSPCWFYDKVRCVNLPGSYKCECFEGYEPRSYSYEPHKTTCIETSINIGPAVIVVFTTLVLMSVSCCVHNRVKKRATSSN